MYLFYWNELLGTMIGDSFRAISFSSLLGGFGGALIVVLVKHFWIDRRIARRDQFLAGQAARVALLSQLNWLRVLRGYLGKQPEDDNEDVGLRTIELHYQKIDFVSLSFMLKEDDEINAAWEAFRAEMSFEVVVALLKRRNQLYDEAIKEVADYERDPSKKLSKIVHAALKADTKALRTKVDIMDTGESSESKSPNTVKAIIIVGESLARLFPEFKKSVKQFDALATNATR